MFSLDKKGNLVMADPKDPTKYVIVLDTLIPTLGELEVKTLSKCQILCKKSINSAHFLKVFSSDKKMRKLSERSAYVKEVYKWLGRVEDLPSQTLKKAFRNPFLSYPGIPGTFKIEVNKTFLSNKISRKKVIRKMAEKIETKTQAEVSLNSPNKVFTPFFNSNFILLAKFPPKIKNFRNREPRYRPYSPSITMEAKLSRALVNLSQTRKGKTFLDPFCGSGSFLLEAASIGAKTIGCDLSKKHLAGAKWNARFFNLASEIQVQQADATSLPFSNNTIWSIASDLPYGKAASLFNRHIQDLYSNFLQEAQRVLKPDRYLAFCASESIEKVEKKNWKQIFQHRMDLPGDLVRYILVLRNVER